MLQIDTQTVGAHSRGHFDRTLLPDPLTYYAERGVEFQERTGKWRTAGCPFHGSHDSLRVNVKTGGFKCMAGCGAHGGNVLDFEMALTGEGFATAAQALGAWVGRRDTPATVINLPRPPQALPHHAAEQRTSLSNWGRKLWEECRPISGVAEVYLKTRGCVIPPQDGDLRWHPSLTNQKDGYTGPALVALVTHECTREPLTLHRTWVRADAEKPCPHAKLLLGGHSKEHGVIRLWDDECVTYGLAVAEGIETALSLARIYKPVWALVDSSNLAKFGPLAGIEDLVVARDNDPAGWYATQLCADRWRTAGVTVTIPVQLENDLNDTVRRAA